MPIQIPQTSYALSPPVALPGQLADAGPVDITSGPAAELIPPGRAVQFNADGSVRLCQNAGAGLGDFGGVSLYEGMREPGGYPIGAAVPVLRKGRVYADWNGTVQDPFSTPNVNHSSTAAGAANRGVFTDAAVSTTAGAEVATAPEGVILRRDTGSTSLCLVELNLPA